jgi:large subunit ribosomal protein L13
MKTYQPRKKDVKRNWHLIDAKNQILGRLATKIATYLTGKHKVNYSAHMDMGDYVVVINAKDIVLTGKKESQKVYRKHSGYPGGFKEIKFEKMQKENPERIIELSVSGMLPGNRLKRKRMARLKVFSEERHPYGDKLKIQN